MNISRTLQRRLVAPLLGSVAALVPTHGADIQKANNTTVLNAGGSWVGGVVPTINDVAVYNNLITLANTSVTGGSLTLGGIRIANPTGSVIFGNTNGATITLGTSGVDMSAATAALLLEGAIALQGDQTWAVANASTAGAPFAGTARQFNNNEDFAFSAGNTTGNGIAFNMNGSTVTTTGAGTIEITSGYTVSNGTFNVGNSVFHVQGGASKLTTIASDVTFNVAAGSRVFFQSNSGALSSAATFNLNGGTLQWTSNNANNGVTQSGPVNVNAASTLLVANTVAANGGSTGPLIFSGNLSGSAALAINNTATAANFLRLAGNNSAYTGTVTFGGNAGKNTRMTSVDAGSAAATWNVSTDHTLELDGVGVQLGTLVGGGVITNSNASTPAGVTVGAGNFAGSINDGLVFNGMSLTKVGPGTLFLSGANTYTGNTVVNAGSLIAAPGSLGFTNVSLADGAEFGPRILSPGGTLSIPGLTVGASTGGTVSFELGNFGNPVFAPLTVNNFVPQAPTTLKVVGTGFTTGTFTLLDYGGSIGGLGLPGLTLALPPRVVGSLSNDLGESALKVTITGLDTPKWTGATNGTWDIDDGTGTGTVNWREINNGTATRYLQTDTGSDTVLFDDSATGTTNVTLATALNPNGVTINNSLQTYTFGGPGRLSGQTNLSKLGSGTVRFHNLGANDYAGGTFITEGTVELGDGVTPGAGTLGPGAVSNDGTIVFNRPDAFTFGSTLTGSGGFVKNGAEAVTFTGAVNQAGPITVSAGSVVFNGGGTLSGAISGPGALTSTAGNFELSGAEANTYTGETLVSGGNLRLNKPASVNAIGGNVTIAEGATLTLVSNEQIPDTATLSFIGTSADSLAGSVGTETLANVFVNPSVATGQVIMRNNFNVTNVATLQNGILGVASGHTATVNSVVMSGGILRVAGNSAGSTLNIGPGGITASGGVIEVKFNTNDQDAILNLNGDFTATGNIAINNANYAGFSLNQVVLFGQRTFNLAAGTTTTVQPDVAGAGGLTKIGAGTLDLRSRVISYSGDTIITAGTLRTSTSTHAGTASITVQDGGTLELRIPVPGTSLVAPAMTFGSVTGSTTRFDLSGQGNPTAAPLATTSLTAQGSNILSIIGATTAGTFPLIDYSGSIGGAGIGGFSLQLPLRVAGFLVNNTDNTSIDVTIQGVDTPKWRGDVNGNWDIDDGTGTGTANWRGQVTNNATRYLEVAAGTDHVIFDDTATGTTAVSLATTLKPSSITVDNTNLEYSFVGPGKLSGTMELTKLGAGLLIVANSSDNDFSGPINIAAPGAIQVGNGAIAGAGSLGTGPIMNEGALILNRPDEFTLVNAIQGAGSIIQAGSGKATLIGPLTYFGTTTVNAGTLALNSPSTITTGVSILTGATLSLDHAVGTVSGNIANNGTLILNNTASMDATISGTGGILVNTGGNKAIRGATANTFTGLSNVLAGTLILAKSDGVNGLPAISGDLVIDGGVVNVDVFGNQFADNSSITVNSGQILSTFENGNNKDDTIANLTIHAATPVSTFNGFNITGTLTITAGVQHDAVNTNGTTTANRAILSNTNIRLGANSGPSTLNIGSGGLSLTNASIVYGSAGNAAQMGTVNLGGNVQSSGNSAFDVNTGNPMSRIDLGADTRTFEILDGTLTVESSIVSFAPTAGVTKTGPGTLVLAAGSNTNGESSYTGDTNLNAGVFVVNGSLSGTNIIVNGGTLAGSGIINPGLAGVVFEDGGKLAPGTPTAAGLLTVNGSIAVGNAVADTLSAALHFDLDTAFSSDRVSIPAGVLDLGNGVLEFDDFVFTALPGFTDQTTYVLFETNSPILGGLGPNIGGAINGMAAHLQLSEDNTDLVLLVPEPGSAMLLLGGLAMLTARRRRTT